MIAQPDPAAVASAYCLVDGLSDRTGISSGVLLRALSYLPENMLSLLDYPEGWSALAEFVAADLGLAPFGYRPTVH